MARNRHRKLKRVNDSSVPLNHRLSSVGASCLIDQLGRRWVRPHLCGSTFPNGAADAWVAKHVPVPSAIAAPQSIYSYKSQL